jgi:hypothetical protein
MNHVELFKFEEAECPVCEAMFRKEVLADDEYGRCPICAVSGHTSKNKPEQEFIKTDKMKREELKVLLKELLDEIKDEKRADDIEAAFKPKKCTRCGNEFLPRSPAMKVCDDCQVQARKEKK